MPQEKKPITQNLTVPNALSVLRIIVIPFFAWFFMHDQLAIAVALLVLSGLSDCVDGFIARKLNQVTELGKMLDPLADKLTQGVVALCLAIKFPGYLPGTFGFHPKRAGDALRRHFAFEKEKNAPAPPRWYGKVATVMFYVSVALIVVMDGFLHVEGVAFQVISYVLLGLTAAMMIYSAVKYAQIFLKILRSDDSKYDLSLTDEIRAKTVRDKRIKIVTKTLGPRPRGISAFFTASSHSGHDCLVK